MRKDAARRRARRRRIHAQPAEPWRSLSARRLIARSERAFDARHGDDPTVWGILSMTFMPTEVIASLEPMRRVPRRPRPDDVIAYEIEASTHLELHDPAATRASLSTRIADALDRLDAAEVDPVLFADPEAWFRTFVTLSTGTWTLSRDVVRRLALLHSNVWIDAP